VDLPKLVGVEAFEQFLHRAFPGKTRFSIEGLDLLIPILDVILDGLGRVLSTSEASR